jgi:hypothetical protein
MAGFQYKGTDLSELIATSTDSNVTSNRYNTNNVSVKWATTTAGYAKITQGVNQVFKSGNADLTDLSAKAVNIATLSSTPAPSWANAFKVHMKSINGATGNTGTPVRYHSGQGKAPNMTGYNNGGAGGAGGAGAESYINDMYTLPPGTIISGSANSIHMRNNAGSTLFTLNVNNGVKGNDGGDGSTGHNARFGNDGANGNTGAAGTVSSSVPGVSAVNDTPNFISSNVDSNTSVANIYFFKL